MNNQQKLDKIAVIFAYDMGATDSGIKDDAFKESLRNDESLGGLLTELAKQMLNSEQGYTLEDIKQLIDWAEDELGYYF